MTGQISKQTLKLITNVTTVTIKQQIIPIYFFKTLQTLPIWWFYTAILRKETLHVMTLNWL
jgi:hypothetical protein